MVNLVSLSPKVCISTPRPESTYNANRLETIQRLNELEILLKHVIDGANSEEEYYSPFAGYNRIQDALAYIRDDIQYEIGIILDNADIDASTTERAEDLNHQAQAFLDEFENNQTPTTSHYTAAETASTVQSVFQRMQDDFLESPIGELVTSVKFRALIITGLYSNISEIETQLYALKSDVNTHVSTGLNSWDIGLNNRYGTRSLEALNVARAVIPHFLKVPSTKEFQELRARAQSSLDLTERLITTLNTSPSGVKKPIILAASERSSPLNQTESLIATQSGVERPEIAAAASASSSALHAEGVQSLLESSLAQPSTILSVTCAEKLEGFHLEVRGTGPLGNWNKASKPAEHLSGSVYSIEIPISSTPYNYKIVKVQNGETDPNKVVWETHEDRNDLDKKTSFSVNF